MKKSEYGRPIPVEDYHVEDVFWSKKMELVRTKMIPYQWNVLNDRQEGVIPSHSIENFRIAAGLAGGEFQGYVFQDSDLAKWLEAVGYSLCRHKDPELERQADEAIDLILQAQRPDGYMDTYYIINGLDKAWTNIADNHELYCAGHMIEAAIAYYAGTGKRKLLDAVIRLADCIDRHFGPEEGKLHGYPGHEIIEMALVRLYHVTGEARFLRLAKYFINQRGQDPNFFVEERKRNGNENPWEKSAFQYQYYQADRPVREQTEAEGHAVRAVYLYSGMAAVAKETGDESLQEACRRLWRNVALRQMYITGAIGASPYGESFTFDYDLPNDTIYGETCAAIGLVFFSRRMLELERKAMYADVMERAFYNACLAGMSREGTSFFYVNPLEVVPEASEKDEGKRHVLTKRRRWFNCACCPTNLARLISSVGHYAATENDRGLAFHLYIGGEIEAKGCGMKVQVQADLPWNGDVRVEIREAPEEERCRAFRIPGWCRGEWQMKKNGEMMPHGGAANQNVKEGYLELTDRFMSGDCLEFTFAMPVLAQMANPRVREDIGRAAVSRGPIIYCLEEADMGKDLHRLFLPAETVFQEVPGRLGSGTVDLETDGLRLSDEGWGDALYASDIKPQYDPCRLHLVPYYLWNNRGVGEMRVWLGKGQS